jgi:sigma-E factor negative regulatory protein RseC
MKEAVNETIDHEGIVTSISGRSVFVSISAKSACSGCHAKSSCSMLGGEVKIIEVKGDYNVKPGETVNVRMAQSTGFKALALGYFLPFMALFLVLITLISLKVPELTAGLLAIGALLPYYLILYLFRKKLNEKFTFTLKV